MNSILWLATISIFLSCGLKDSKFVRKKIGDTDITIRWFYYSYVTNLSPDFVVVEKDNEKKELYKATGVILDVSIKDHNIILKLVQKPTGPVYTTKVEDNIFGHKVIVDTTGTYDELRLIPDGIKECQ